MLNVEKAGATILNIGIESANILNENIAIN
jgi:hypothetical protein